MRRKPALKITFIFLFLLMPMPGLAMETAENASWWNRFKNRVVQTWNSPTYDLYMPLYTWHNRYTYDKDKTDKYHENPWGIGVGRSMFDEDGDWHALYAMGFQDSYNMFEPIVGYGFQKIWRPGKSENWRVGGGFTAGITARQQYNYIPMPLPLPMFGVGYKQAALQAVYIPGTKNNGNVLFCWLRWQVN